MKRGFDVAVSLLALTLALPVLAALALWVRLDSPGPALFRQTRVGRGGRPFQMLKLRTMVVGAAAGGHATAAGDARITRAGRVLRRLSLDELPQLWNVLLGEMSLVGPRPDVPAQKALYAPEDWVRRTAVRPGITGLAQARLRSAATPEERLALDLAYVARPTLAHDLAILWETLHRLFRSPTT